MDLAELAASFPRSLTAFVALVGALVIYRGIRRAIVALTRQGHLNAVMASRLTSLVRWLVVGSTLLVIVQVAGVFQGAWAVLSAFLATAAVAFFALWSVLSNVVCSLMILVYRPFRLGDHLEVMDASNSYSGEVRDMNLMFTTLRSTTEEGEELLIRVPNSFMFQKPLRCRSRAERANTSFFDLGSA